MELALNGTKVRIWKDSWIPYVNWFLAPHDQIGMDLLTAMVDHLIDRDQQCWNIQVLNTCFPHSTLAAILKIPLSSNPHPDKLIWREENNGNSTVRSAYRLIQSN